MHGTCISHSGFKHGVLEGTYGKSTIGENIKSYKEGWVVNQWGTNSMGRWMLYKTINMDELPTSWTHFN